MIQSNETKTIWICVGKYKRRDKEVDAFFNPIDTVHWNWPLAAIAAKCIIYDNCCCAINVVIIQND